MKKILCVFVSVVSLNAASICVEECGAIVRFKQEMGRIYQNNVDSDDVSYHDLSFDELQHFRDQWCSNVPQSAHLKDALIRLGNMSDKEICEQAQNLLCVLEDVLFNIPRKGNSGCWKRITNQLNNLEDLLF